MVSAAQDADAVDDKAKLSHAVDYRESSGGPYSRVAAVGVAVTVTDDDTAGVTVSETTLTLAEGASATYTVVLDAQPTSNVLIRIDLKNLDVKVDADAGRAGAQVFMLFTPGNWNMPQTVKVSADQDADAADDKAQLSHAVAYVDRSSGGPYSRVAAAGVAVTVTDDETAGVTVSETTLTVAEGASNTYTVVLDVQPAADVVIAVSSNNTDVTATPARLTFTSSNWSTAQTVTVRAAHDADAVNDTASIAHAVVAAESADEYDTATIAGVAVTVSDDDAGVTNSESTLVVAEGGSATYTVKLNTRPSADVAIIIADDNPDVTADTDAATSGNQDRLTFTPANWSTPQTVTVAAAHDADAVNDKAQLRYTVSSGNASGPYSGLAADGVAVTVTDDDDAGVTVSETTLTVDEGGNNTYTVVLDAQPVSNVVISVTKSGSADVTVSPATLTFTSINWGTAQTVTVAAAHDADAADDTASIAHAVNASQSADEYDTAAIAGVAVTVDDDETAGATVSKSRLRMDEGGSNTYTVALKAQPASDVVIAVTSNNSDVTVDTDAATSGSQNTLTFTPSNWSTAQTVTLAADQDADAANDAASISHAVVAAESADEYDNVTIARVRVTVVDDETPTAGVTSSVSRLTVAEGGSATYTVVLNTSPPPGFRVRVFVILVSDGNVTLAPSRLDFTSSDWSTAQTVTVSAAQDTEGSDRAQVSYTVQCICSQYNRLTYDNVVEVIVVDDDAVGVTLSETAVSVIEGGNSNYTVVLNNQPSSDVVIDVTKSGSSDVTVSPATLTFTPANWRTAQPVTVRAAQDADAVNDAASITHAVDASRSANEYDNVSIAGVAVTVDDDETAGMTMSETTLTVDEGGNGAYTVVLDVQPTSDVVITLTSNNSDVTVDTAVTSGSQNTLTFTPSNWSVAQTVTVAADQDADAANDAASISHAVVASRSANEYDNVTIAELAVTVTDDEIGTAGVTSSVSSLSVAEGGSATYTVVLDAQPEARVRVWIVLISDGNVSRTPRRLDFTPSNWSTPQTVTLSAAQDTDRGIIKAQISYFITCASSCRPYDNNTTYSNVVEVIVVDDEVVGATLTETTLTVLEGGNRTYTVVLNRQPTSDVVINVTKSGSDDLTATPASLTFTTSNWNTPQTVTVRAAEDDDAANDTASISHAVVAAQSANEYDAVTIAGVAVTVTDDETAGVTVSETTLTVAEGASGAYTVKLDPQPSSDVVITVSSDNTDVTVSPATLTFTTANWSTAQTVTVAAAQDADAVNDAASISHAVDASRSANEYDNMTIAGVAVTVTDDDTAGVSVSETTLTVDEGGNNTYTVKLDAQPASNVVISVTKTRSTDVTVSPATLTFTTSNWNTAQTVTVAAAQDADAVNDAASITHAVVAASSANEFDAVSIAGVAVTVTDDDTAGVTVSKSTLTVAEGGSGAYTVVLDALPTSDVVISVTRTGSSDVTLDTDTGTSGNQTTLTFTPANWDTAQTVTVAAAQDADAVSDAASITHAVVASRSADEFDAVTIAGVAVTVTDDESAGVTVSKSTLTVDEGGSGSYTVVLNLQPTSDVVINVTKSGSSDVTPDTDTGTSGNQTTLTFTRANWDTAQTVTVAAAQDADAVDGVAAIAHAVVAAQSANEYDAVSIAGVAVTVTDDDAGVTVSPATLRIPEGNNSTYTVVLDALPAADVVISVTASGNSDVTVSPATLTFTPSNWSTAKTVTVAAAQDVDAVNDTAAIAHAVDAARSANEFDAVTIAGVAVTVTDDDTAGVTVSVTSVTAPEGDSGAYTVVLDVQPSSDVVISVTKSGSPDVTVSPATLTFTPSNWDTAQTVTVRAAQDADVVDDMASISHAVVAARSANEFDLVTVAGVAVTVTDDDTAGVTVYPTSYNTFEDTANAYNVKLDAQPSSDVVIRVASTGSSDVTVDTDRRTPLNQKTLTFTPSNWSTVQRVWVVSAADDDAVDDMASITHEVVAAESADEYDSVMIVSFAVTVTDDESAGVTVSKSTLTVAEGGSGSYTVVLDVQPASDVVIGVTRTGSTDVTVSPATLTFSSSNWATAQTVTVAAAQDADAVDDPAAIAHAVDASRSANEFDAVSIAGVAVTVTDDDTAGVTVSASSVTVAEGASATYTVKLNTQPTSNVVISVTKTGSTDVTLDTDTGTSGNQTTLTFSSSNWATAQTVTVAAAQDADAVNDTAAITHAVDASQSANEFDAVTIAGVAVTVTDDETAGVTVSETTLTVAEGGSGSYTVVLNLQPTSDVVITMSSDNSDVTVSPARLTFSSSNWATAQTVRVSAAQDADAVSDTAAITHAVVAASSADEFDLVTVAGVRVTVTDDDTAGVTVSKTTLTVDEGGSGSYTVVLNLQPTSDVVINVTKSGSDDVTVSPATLTFTTSNWATAQTVTVAAAQDADAVNDAASITHAVDASRSANEYDAVTIAGVTVTVTDDDTAGVTVSASSVTVAEGASATYTVVLDAQPASNVVISVTKTGSNDVTVSPATLTFSSSNWDTAQTVTVAAAQDADAVNDPASIAHAVDAARSANEFDPVTIARVAVTVTDGDTAGVTVSKTTLTVDEGGNGSYTVKLDAQPASDVVIGVTKSGSPDVTVSPATLTFSSSNWDTAQTVTVAAAQDADAVNDAASITHAVDASRSANEFDPVTIAGVTVTVADDDTAGVTVSETTLTITEGNSSTYTVKLNTQPASDVVIGVTKTGSTDVTVSPATLTFSSSNWDTAQTVTVRAAQDADAANDAASIAHAVDASRSANEFDAVTIAGVAVTVTDNDTAGATVSKTTLTVDEGGSGSYTVVLNLQPTSDVVINVTKSGSDDVTVSPATLTFTTSNWSTAQTVTVAAAQDTDAVNDAASITHRVVAAQSANEYDAVSIAGVAVTVTDDDAGATVSETTLTVTEGASATYTVVLDAQPSGNVVISVTASGNTDVTVSPATLTFSSSNWSTAKTVTVAAAQDDDAVNDTASIAHAVVAASSADEFDAVTIAGVAVTVTDDDTAGVTVSKTTLTVTEGGSATYTVKLNTQPASDVVISVTKTGSSDVTVSPARLTFTRANWDTAQTVTVRAAQDADTVNDAASIAHAVVAASSANEYDNVNIAGVAVTVTDNDTAGATVSETTLTITEGGSGSYTVKLAAQPTSNVVISVTASGNTDVTASPATLTFTTSNWSTAQTVTVRAAQDDDAVDDTAAIAHAVDAAQSANEYDNVNIAGVAVTVTDDDTAGATVSKTTLTVNEGGSGSYTVVLNTQPTSDVVISVTASGNTDVTASPATLTFTTSNWSTAQTVTVRAAQDDDAVNDAAAIAHAVVAASSANEFDAVSIAGVAVTVTDDDTAGVMVSKTTLTVAEGASGSYTVKLNTQPASNVVIGVTRTGSSDVTVSPARLTFTRANWDTAQTVTVRAAQDADAVSDAASITHAVVAASSADEFDAVSIAGVAVTVTDNDTAGATVSKTTLPITEGNSSTYTVRLNTQPASDVVISVTKTGSSDVTVSPARLTFTRANWDTAQTVTVRAAQDSDAVNDAASITHAVVAASSADEFDAVTIAGVAVTVTDNDTAGATVSETTLTVAEGGSGSYTVRLNTQPASDVVISVTKTGSTDVTASPATLTFTTSNWSTAQTVTVRAAQDVDAANDTAAITHAVDAASSANEYDNVNIAGVAVTVTDDDTAGVTVSASTLSVTEGASATYTVVLNTQPTSNVVISVTKTGSTDVTASPATLTFTTSNWSTAQTVTVRAAQDADTVNDAAAIAHAVDASRSANEFDAVTIAGVAVTVTDDDTAGVTVSASTLSVTEGGSATYTVRLNTQPTSNVVISVTKTGSTDVTASPATLTFTTSNWSTAKTVTVRAAQDADAANDTAAIAHAVVAAQSANEYDAVTIAGVTVSVTDDDTVNIGSVAVSETTLTVAEGSSATYTVRLNTQPTSNVVISVTRTGSSDVTASPATLTFTTSNWSTAKTVTVRAAQDADAANDTAAITHAVVAAQSANEYDAVTIGSVAVTVTDDDTVTIGSVAVSETTLTVAEGSSATYTVRLNTQPTSNVVISVTRTGSTDVTASPATLTFTTSNWSTAKTVTVRAAQDADAANDTAAITHAVVAAQSANEYDAVTIGSVAVTVTDDETAGVSPPDQSPPDQSPPDQSPPDQSPTFASRTVDDQVYTIGEDVGTVSLPYASQGNGRLRYSLSPDLPEGLRFNSDRTITGTPRAKFPRTRFTYTASDIDGDRVHLRFHIIVNQAAGVTVSPTDVTVTEGGSDTYTVVLNAHPASDVVITVSSDNTDVAVSPARLTFTPSNWSTAQTVRVSAAQDADAVNDAASIAHAVDASRSADEFDDASVAGVTVTVTDDDAGVSVSEITLSITEGGSATFTVVLNAQPASDVVISVTASGNTDVTVSPARLTFTPANWSTAKTVTVRAAQDSDAVNDAATISHAVVADDSDDLYDGLRIARVRVTVTDDDAGVSVSASTLSVAEGGSDTYTVVLDGSPSSNVVITVTSGNMDVTVSPARLTFTPANWNTAQTVTVRAAQDADAASDAAAIAHAVDAARSANEFDLVTVAGVTVTVTDDETAGATVSETTLTVAEGGSDTYTVKLDAQPASDVVITVTSGNMDVTVSPARLTFTPANWSTAKTVRVSAAEDADAVNDAASITHAVVAASSANEFDLVTVAGVWVTVTDDDTAGATVSETTLTVAEGGSATYTVVLDAQPASDVVIGVTTSGSSDVTVLPATLTFTSSNWDTAQTVTVRAAKDADAANDAAAIAHTVDASRSAAEYDLVTVAGVWVTVTDDDTAGGTVSETTLTVVEGGSNISVWVLALISVLLNLMALGVTIRIWRRR